MSGLRGLRVRSQRKAASVRVLMREQRYLLPGEADPQPALVGIYSSMNSQHNFKRLHNAFKVASEDHSQMSKQTSGVTADQTTDFSWLFVGSPRKRFLQVFFHLFDFWDCINPRLEKMPCVHNSNSFTKYILQLPDLVNCWARKGGFSSSEWRNSLLHGSVNFVWGPGVRGF